jgi:hypothetical protein
MPLFMRFIASLAPFVFRVYAAAFADIRVPFYVRGPGVPMGATLPPTTIVNNVDIGPTLLDLAGRSSGGVRTRGGGVAHVHEAILPPPPPHTHTHTHQAFCIPRATSRTEPRSHHSCSPIRQLPLGTGWCLNTGVWGTRSVGLARTGRLRARMGQSPLRMHRLTPGRVCASSTARTTLSMRSTAPAARPRSCPGQQTSLSPSTCLRIPSSSSTTAQAPLCGRSKFSRSTRRSSGRWQRVLKRHAPEFTCRTFLLATTRRSRPDPRWWSLYIAQARPARLRRGRFQSTWSTDMAAGGPAATVASGWSRLLHCSHS